VDHAAASRCSRAKLSFPRFCNGNTKIAEADFLADMVLSLFREPGNLVGIENRIEWRDFVTIGSAFGCKNYDQQHAAENAQQRDRNANE
jgi:hypothetical protein